MDKIEFEIRTSKVTDLPEMHAVRHLAFASVYESFRDLVGGSLAEVVFHQAEEQQGMHLDAICRENSGHAVFVAVHNDKIIGFCGASLNHKNNTGTLGLNAVHPEFANQGVGNALYQAGMAWMKQLGMEAVQVFTGDDPSHAPARRAYEKAGFHDSIPTRSYYRLL